MAKLARVRWLIVLTLVLMAGSSPHFIRSQSRKNPLASRHEEIIVKIRNGKTGLPIWLASPYVFVGKTDPSKFADSYRRTRFWGDAHVDVTGADPREVRVWIDFIHQDCRLADDDSKFRTFDYSGSTLRGLEAYSLELVMSKGVVSQNTCGKKTQAPEPGVLTIYVIPATFKELWNT